MCAEAPLHSVIPGAPVSDMSDQRDVVVVRAADASLLEGPGDVITRILVDRGTGAANVSMGHMRFPVGGKTDTHVRDVEEFIYAISGSGAVVFDDGRVLFQAGDAIFIPPGRRHYHENAGEVDFEHLWVFSPQGPEEKLRGLPLA